MGYTEQTISGEVLFERHCSKCKHNYTFSRPVHATAKNNAHPAFQLESNRIQTNPRLGVLCPNCNEFSEEVLRDYFPHGYRIAIKTYVDSYVTAFRKHEFRIQAMGALMLILMAISLAIVIFILSLVTFKSFRDSFVASNPQLFWNCVFGFFGGLIALLVLLSLLPCGRFQAHELGRLSGPKQIEMLKWELERQSDAELHEMVTQTYWHAKDVFPDVAQCVQFMQLRMLRRYAMHRKQC